MSVTKIIFKQGAPTIPFTQESIAALQGSVGEPLWHTTRKELYVSDGANAPVLIGPYTHPTVTVTADANSAVTTPSGTTNQKAAANANYAISSVTVDAEGHLQAIETVALPATPTVPTITYTQNPTIDGNGANDYQIGTLSDGVNTWTLYGKDVVGTSGTAEELTANNAATPADGSAVLLKTDNGNKTVTLKHEAQSNSVGTYATFTASAESNNNIDVTVAITEINGGTWS